MSSSSSVNDDGNRDSYTEVSTERIVHNWTIKRFNLLRTGIGARIFSRWFYSRDKSEKWRFILCPRGMDDNPSDGIEYVGLFLARDSPAKLPTEVYTEMTISKSNVILINSSFTFEYKPRNVWGFEKFLERSKLLTTNSSVDDQFTISCVIDIPMKLLNSSFDAVIFDSKKSKLRDDLRSLFEDPVFSDFTIIVGDQKFPTHRNILAKRSPVFAAMFEHKDLEENRKKEVKIKNIEPDVIKGMLEFIYTDQVTNIKELASGLLEAADKYDLEELKIMCEKTLYEGLNKENAAEVLQLADLHCADTLKKYAMKYIVDHASDVVRLNDWKKTGWRSELLLELVDQFAHPQAVNTKKSPSSLA